MPKPYYEIRIPFLPIIQKVLDQLTLRSGGKESLRKKPGRTKGITFPLDEFSPMDLESTRRFFSEMTEILSLEISSRLPPTKTPVNPPQPSSAQNAPLSVAVNIAVDVDMGSRGTVKPSTPSEGGSLPTVVNMDMEVDTDSGGTKTQNADLQPTRRSQRLIARKSLLAMANNKSHEENKLVTDAVNADVEMDTGFGGTVELPMPSERNTLLQADTDSVRTEKSQLENTDLQPTRRSERLIERKALSAHKRVDEESGSNATKLISLKKK